MSDVLGPLVAKAGTNVGVKQIKKKNAEYCRTFVTPKREPTKNKGPLRERVCLVFCKSLCSLLIVCWFVF